MKHDELKGLIPEYLQGTLGESRRKELEDHLRECSACNEEASILQAMMDDNVPDPGDIFWDALPQRVVRHAVSEDRRVPFYRSLLSLKFAFTAAVIVLAAGLYILTVREPVIDKTAYVRDPLEFSYMDYQVLTTDELPVITEDIEESDVFPAEDHILAYSYQDDLIMMSDDELEALGDLINSYRTNGG